MSISDLISEGKIVFDSFYMNSENSAKKADLITALENIYAIPEVAAMLDGVTSAGPVRFHIDTFNAPRFQSDTGEIFVDPSYQTAHIANDGKTYEVPFERVLLHEILHRFGFEFDGHMENLNLPDADYVGDTVREVNRLLEGFQGDVPRSTYVSMNPDFSDFVGREWTNGQQVDYVLFASGRPDLN